MKNCGYLYVGWLGSIACACFATTYFSLYICLSAALLQRQYTLSYPASAIANLYYIGTASSFIATVLYVHSHSILFPSAHISTWNDITTTLL